MNKKLKAIIILASIALGLYYLYIHTFIEKVYIGVKVVSHSTASDRYGNITYYTVLECEDGEYRNTPGMNWYTMPIGTQRTIVEKLIKWK